MVGWIKKMKKKMDGLDGQKKKYEKKMDGWMDKKRWIKKMDGWMDEKIDGWLDGQKKYMKKIWMVGWIKK